MSKVRDLGDGRTVERRTREATFVMLADQPLKIVAYREDLERDEDGDVLGNVRDSEPLLTFPFVTERDRDGKEIPAETVKIGNQSFTIAQVVEALEAFWTQKDEDRLAFRKAQKKAAREAGPVTVAQRAAAEATAATGKKK